MRMRLRLPVNAAGAIAATVILCTEWVFLARTEPLTGLRALEPTADEATVVAKRGLLPRAPGQILFVGDSSCIMELDPAVFTEEGLGRPVNLGTLASFTMPGFAALAEEAMDCDPPPRAVVVAVLPRSFEMTEAQARDFNLIGRYLTAYGRKSPAYEVGAGDVWSWFVHKHRFNIFPAEFGGSYAAYQARVDASNGFLQERGTYTGAKGSEVREQFHPTDYCRTGFRRLADAAAAKGVPVVLWWSPSPADAVSSEYLAGASRYADELVAATPGLKTGRPAAPAWEPYWFGSVTHLTPTGARKNSLELAAYLKCNGSFRPDLHE
jgi:hypothetical protein